MAPKKKIKEFSASNKIQTHKIQNAEIDYPIFSFRYLQFNSIKDCRNHNFFLSFLKRLKELSGMSWNDIRLSRTHNYGMEPIPLNEFKPQTSLPDIITPEVKKLHVFRANKCNNAFVGLQMGRIFHIIYIEASFGDIYDHKSK